MRTDLYEVHREAGARMTDFAGFEMPLQYSSIVEEHLAVRGCAGLFDVSHMGEFMVCGERSRAFLDFLLTGDLMTLDGGGVRYSPMCNAEGGTIDDLLVYCIDSERFMMVVNAGNISKDRDHIEDVAESFGGVRLEDRSRKTSLLALQGPEAEKILVPLVDFPPSALKGFHFREGTVGGRRALISRTGYTGEDGFEIFLGNDDAVDVWKILLEGGREYGLKPAGLGARDTLRLEAGMPLYGNELDEKTSPLTAGLGFAVSLGGSDFLGRGPLEREKRLGSPRKLIGLEIEGRGVPRDGYPVHVGGEERGWVTSGSFSPVLRRGIALAYVERGCSRGQDLEVRIRGRMAAAKWVSPPFVT